MIIDYISDIHIDFWLDKNIAKEEYLDSYLFKEVFKTKKGEILLIAGDLGHNNEQSIDFLELLINVHGYKHIFVVFGNHDYYLLNAEYGRFNKNSFNRIEAFKQLATKSQNITLLDGDIVTYKDIKIGGCRMWYDGNYGQLLNRKLTQEGLHELWKNTMMDAIHIYGIKHFNDIFEKEVIKMQKIYKESDIILTHI